MKKIITEYHKTLQDLMDAGSVAMGKQSRVDEILTDIARQAGVQPRDIFLVGEFDDSTKELTRTFVGVWNPVPGAERELVEITKVIDGGWAPPNSVRASS